MTTLTHSSRRLSLALSSSGTHPVNHLLPCACAGWLGCWLLGLIHLSSQGTPAESRERLSRISLQLPAQPRRSPPCPACLRGGWWIPVSGISLLAQKASWYTRTHSALPTLLVESSLYAIFYLQYLLFFQGITVIFSIFFVS